MANTHNLTRAQRKFTKRRQRQANKALYASLTGKERGELARSEKSLKGFLKEKGRI
jgi:hypothetical protein